MISCRPYQPPAIQYGGGGYRSLSYGGDNMGSSYGMSSNYDMTRTGEGAGRVQPSVSLGGFRSLKASAGPRPTRRPWMLPVYLWRRSAVKRRPASNGGSFYGAPLIPPAAAPTMFPSPPATMAPPHPPTSPPLPNF